MNSNDPKSKSELLKELVEELRSAGVAEDKVEDFEKLFSQEIPPVQKQQTSSLIYSLIVGLDSLALGEKVDSKMLSEIINEIDRRLPVPSEINLN